MKNTDIVASCRFLLKQNNCREWIIDNSSSRVDDELKEAGKSIRQTDVEFKDWKLPFERVSV